MLPVVHQQLAKAENPHRQKQRDKRRRP